MMSLTPFPRPTPCPNPTNGSRPVRSLTVPLSMVLPSMVLLPMVLLSMVLLSTVLLTGCEEAGGPGELVIGMNAVGEPNSFESLTDGDTIPVVRGTQGAMMVVAAAETNHFGDIDTVEAIFTLEYPDGTQIARYKFRRKVVVDGGGYIFLHDIFLVVEDAGTNSADWADREAILRVTMQRVGGAEAIERSVKVTLQNTEA